MIDIAICVYLLFTENLAEMKLQQYFGTNKAAGILLYLAIGMELLLTEIWPGKFVLEQRFMDIFDKREKARREGDDEVNDSSLTDGKISTGDYAGMSAVDSEPSQHHTSSKEKRV